MGCSLPQQEHPEAPVQEMSDARQAIQAARAVAERSFMPESLEKAERLLAHAAQSLSRGQYTEARSAAVSARQLAISARRTALGGEDFFEGVLPQ